MDIQELRQQIDAIDRELTALYCRRMETARAIGQYKRENGLPVRDTERERKLLNKVAELAGEENEQGIRAVYQMLLDHSRLRQLLDEHPESPIGRLIRETVAETPALFPEKAVVACQGVEGAYSQLACEKIFRYPSITYCRTFGNVFSAIESGLCRYDILPIENSLAGSVNSVYDQMIRHNCFIVRSTRIKIDHTLLALPGVKEGQIREVWSHEQAIQQCSAFLAQHKEWHVNVCSNTAAAARIASASPAGKPSRPMPVSSLMWIFSRCPGARAALRARPFSAHSTARVTSLSAMRGAQAASTAPRIRMGRVSPASRRASASCTQATAR